MNISVNMQGVQALNKRVGLFNERLSNLGPAFASAAVAVLDDAQMQIRLGGDPPWAPKKRPNGLPLLVQKGSLKQSLQAGQPGAVEEIIGGIRVGTDIEYARTQQEGTDRAGARRNAVIPARPYLFRDPDALAVKIRQVFAAYIAGKTL